MREILVKICDLVDKALAKPQIGVLDLTTLNSLLRIIQSILEAKSPITNSKYNAEELVPPDDSHTDETRIVSVSLDDKNELSTHILSDVLFARIFSSECAPSKSVVDIVETIQSDRATQTTNDVSTQIETLSDLVDQIGVSNKTDVSPDIPKSPAVTLKTISRCDMETLLNKQSERLQQLILSELPVDDTAKQVILVVRGDMIVNMNGHIFSKCKAESRIEHEKNDSDNSNGKASAVHESNPNSENLFMKIEELEVSKVNVDQADGHESKPPIDRAWVDLKQKLTAKEISNRDDIFRQLKQMIKNLAKTDDSENRLEMRKCIRKLFEEMEIKIDSYMENIEEKEKTFEKLSEQNYIENGTLATKVEHKMLKFVDSVMFKSVDSFLSKQNERSGIIKKLRIKFLRKKVGATRRLCGGEHTSLRLSERPKVKASYKVKQKHTKSCGHTKCYCNSFREISAMAISAL